jgi:hypothetical protein
VDDRRFDALVRQLALGPASRRQALRLLAGGALAAVLTRLGLAGVPAQECVPLKGACSPASICCKGVCKNEVCCLELGTKCKRGGQCCSGVCSKKTGKCTCLQKDKPCSVAAEHKCCSGNCDGNLCGPCQADDIAITCGGPSCGTKRNNCNQPVNCGVCEAPQTCQNNVCV